MKQQLEYAGIKCDNCNEWIMWDNILKRFVHKCEEVAKCQQRQ